MAPAPPPMLRGSAATTLVTLISSFLRPSYLITSWKPWKPLWFTMRWFSLSSSGVCFEIRYGWWPVLSYQRYICCVSGSYSRM